MGRQTREMLTMSSTQNLVICGLLTVLCLNVVSSYYLDYQYNDIDLSKKSQPYLETVTFPCQKRTMRCYNGGQGPRVTKIRNRFMVCTCRCPVGYTKPFCGRSWGENGYDY